MTQPQGQPERPPRPEARAATAAATAASLAGLVFFAAIIGSFVWILYRWQVQAYPLWADRIRFLPADEQAGGLPAAVPEGRIGEAGPDVFARAEEEASSPASAGLPATELQDGRRPRGPAARLAVVIDDWGYDWGAAGTILALDGPITVAIIPFLPHSVEQARRAAARGFEVIVHLPMEALDGTKHPGPGAITVDLSDEEIRARVRDAIAAVPGATGVSNHMGSKATSDGRVMEQVLQVVREEGLFFLDSATSPRSVAGAVARRMGVPWARNTLFVDGVGRVDAVRARLKEAAARAGRNGWAIAIGHVHAATAAALEATLPELRRDGIELVPVSALLNLTYCP